MCAFRQHVPTKPLEISANRLGLELRVPSNRILAIVNGERAVTADTALRLARYSGMSPQFWMNAQARYDLEVAEDELAETYVASDFGVSR